MKDLKNGGDMVDKPQNLDDYIQWLYNEHKILIDERLRENYQIVSLSLKEQFEKSDIWNNFVKNIREYNDTYIIDTKYDLFQNLDPPEILIKPFNSLLEKTYRKNILNNTNWPNPPENGWYFPDNWYEKINDIIRTSIIVKYLDGVELISFKIKDICSNYQKECIIEHEVRDEGYYAVHISVMNELTITTMDWKKEKKIIKIEIQITTQLQDNIRKLLHQYYAETRLRKETEKNQWQWNYTSVDFSRNYLGHILHYLEGMIMDIREKQKKVM